MTSRRASASDTSDFPWPCGQLLPIRDAVYVPADESQSTILRNNQSERVTQCLAQAISRTVACSHPIGPDPFPLGALHVERSRHTCDLRQLARDLYTEAHDLQ